MKLFSFKGRSHRLAYFGIGVVTSLILGPLYFAEIYGLRAEYNLPGLIWLVAAPVFWVSLATSFRRLHDMGMTGWLVLLTFVPFAGTIWALCMLFWPGQKEANKYGPPPGASAAPEAAEAALS